MKAQNCPPEYQNVSLDWLFFQKMLDDNGEIMVILSALSQKKLEEITEVEVWANAQFIDNQEQIDLCSKIYEACPFSMKDWKFANV